MTNYFIRHRGPRTVIEPSRLGVGGMTIMAEQTLLQSERDLPPHYHKGLMEICYFVSGERLYYINGEVYKVGANQVFVSWPDEIHWVDSAPYGKARFYYLRLTLPSSPRAYLGLASREAKALVDALRDMPRRYFDLAPGMRTMLARAFDIARGESTPANQLELSLLLSGWLLRLTRFAGGDTGVALSPDIAAILTLVRDNAGALQSVEELAATAALSVSRLKAKFKKEVGLPPWEYVLRRKILAAEELLKRPGMNITRVAMELSFSSSQHFAATFRRFTGSTPTEFIRGKKAGKARGGYDHIDKWVDDGIVHGYVLS